LVRRLLWQGVPHWSWPERCGMTSVFKNKHLLMHATALGPCRCSRHKKRHTIHTVSSVVMECARFAFGRHLAMFFSNQVKFPVELARAMQTWRRYLRPDEVEAFKTDRVCWWRPLCIWKLALTSQVATPNASCRLPHAGVGASCCERQARERHTMAKVLARGAVRGVQAQATSCATRY
jgi:hypothetical protein